MRLVLLGDPVAHSRSPAIHTAALAACGIDGRYEVHRAGRAELEEAVAAIRTGRLDGANVTMPLKRAAAAAADEVDGSVRATGAANTLRGRRDRVEGTNTDVGGIRDAAAAAGIPPGAPVVVLGAGGAAAAAMEAFDTRVRGVVARRKEAALRLTAGTPAVAMSAGEVPAGVIVVNATPLGMAGEELPGGLIGRAAGVVDLAYGASATPAVLEAAQRGLPCADGLAVLVAQAALSFEWWTGVSAPRRVMEAAVRG